MRFRMNEITRSKYHKVAETFSWAKATHYLRRLNGRLY
jgi:hypothetical protein